MFMNIYQRFNVEEGRLDGPPILGSWFDSRAKADMAALENISDRLKRVKVLEVPYRAEECEACDGTGWVPKPHYGPPAGAPDESRCDDCGGSGEV